MLKKINKIFSFSNYGETHHIIRILGIKIKFPKNKYRKARSKNPYYFYKKNKINIKTIPPAEGQIRDIQLANLELLKELDYVCKRNNLQYWIDFGTALGAIRHKGFIPWDDDIDTGMPREDYNKLIKTFSLTSRNPDIYADYVKSPKNTCQCIIKIQHKKCPHLFVDVFPYDYYKEKLTEKERYENTKQIKKYRKILEKQCNPNTTIDKILKLLTTLREEKIIDKTTNNPKSDLVWGIDFNHNWKKWFYDRSDFFPLKSIKFEGLEFSCINNLEKYLSDVYGNYLTYPKKIGVGHNMYADLSKDERETISELIKKEEMAV